MFTPSSPRPRSTIRELALDIALPLSLYFLLYAGLGVPLVASLVISSLPPLARTSAAWLRTREIEGLAALMLAVNVAGIAITFVSGDARLMFVRNSAISSVIGLSILVSVCFGRPLMSDGLKLFVAKRDAARSAAWDRLSAGCAEFQRLELRYSAVWGAVLLAECVARVVFAFTLPVATMAWMSDVIVGVAITVAALLSGALCAERMQRLVAAEAGTRSGPAPQRRAVAA